MKVITVKHLTRYRYDRLVSFGEHRLMFRPRESFDQHVLDWALTISPKPSELRYIHDVFGNCIGIAHFAEAARELTFDSVVRLIHKPENTLDLPSSPDTGMNSYPFAYISSDLPDLQSSMIRSHPDPEGLVTSWSRRFLKDIPRVEASSVLAAMTAAIHAELSYGVRLNGPPQSPSETLRLGRGTCRDFATLMMEAARALGLAARFVSGYLYSAPDSSHSPLTGGGHTHAWVRVFLPNGGWREYDPTNGQIGSQNLIRVAVARDPIQAIPLKGTWGGPTAAFKGMDVEVQVIADA